jgi:hypothetical protein
MECAPERGMEIGAPANTAEGIVVALVAWLPPLLEARANETITLY